MLVSTLYIQFARLGYMYIFLPQRFLGSCGYFVLKAKEPSQLLV